MISNQNHRNDENVSVVTRIGLDETLCHTKLQVRWFSGQEKITVVTENPLSVCVEMQPFMFASKVIPQSAVDIIATTMASWACLFGQTRTNLLVTIPEA